MLAPAEDDRKSDGNMTAGRAGLDVSRHVGAKVGGHAHDESSQETRASYKV
jgi:hypothetical protein